jgi:hypothetical protein
LPIEREYKVFAKILYYRLLLLANVAVQLYQDEFQSGKSTTDQLFALRFEVVKEFVYLGSLMTPTNDVNLEIQRRIQTANRRFIGLRKHLRSSLSFQTKFSIHKTLIHPVLIYGSETWVLTKREENQLLVFERKFLRTICGPKIVSTGGDTTTNSIKSLTAQMP